MAEPAAAFSFNVRARFADNLYRARERAGLSQKEASEPAALTRARLDKIEGGEGDSPLGRSGPAGGRLRGLGGRAGRGRHLEAGLGRRLGTGGAQGDGFRFSFGRKTNRFDASGVQRLDYELPLAGSSEQ